MFRPELIETSVTSNVQTSKKYTTKKNTTAKKRDEISEKEYTATFLNHPKNFTTLNELDFLKQPKNG